MVQTAGDVGEKRGTDVAVGRAVIGGKRGGHRGPDADAVVDVPDAVRDLAESDERDLRRVDDAEDRFARRGRRGS